MANTRRQCPYCTGIANEGPQAHDANCPALEGARSKGEHLGSPEPKGKSGPVQRIAIVNDRQFRLPEEAIDALAEARRLGYAEGYEQALIDARSSS